MLGSPLARQARVSPNATSTTAIKAWACRPARRLGLAWPWHKKRGPLIFELGDITLSSQACGCTLIKHKYRTNRTTHRLSPSIVDISSLGRPGHRGLPQGLVRWLLFSGPRRTPCHDWMVGGGGDKGSREAQLRTFWACANPTLRSQAPACLLHLGLPWRRGPKIKKCRQQARQLSQPASPPASICFTRAGRLATRSDLHNPGTPLPPNPGRLASGISNSCTSVVPPSSHRRPSAWTMCGNCTPTAVAPSATHAGEAPVSTLDVYQIRDLSGFQRLCNTKDCSGTCKPPRRGLTVALCF